VTRHPDLIIVGGGIIGAACAFAASRRDLRVVVLERDAIAGGVTSAGMGHVVVMDDSPAQFALSAFSRSLLNDHSAELPPAIEHQRCGTLWIATDDAEMEAAARRRELYLQHGARAELLDARSLAEAEPMLRPGLAGALLVPDDGVIYQPAFTAWLIERAVDAGAELREHCAVRGLLPHGVRTADGDIAGGAVLLAAGVESTALLPELPIIPRKGHLAVTTRGPGLVRHQLVELGYLASAHTLTAASVAFNVQPRHTGQVLIGSSRELVGFDRSINHAVLGAMLDRALAFMPGLARVDVLRVWTGLRPATADKLPFIGRWPDGSTPWVATGHEGLGITAALGTGELMAALLTGETPPLDPAPFDPARALAATGA
jgi:glycine/D-amino acid oxidase-like deaminating enzyme